MSGLPLAAKTSITSLLVAALGLALIVLVRGPQLESGDAIIALVIGGSTTAAWLRPVHFASRTKLYVDTAITFAAVLILPLPLAMLATGLGTLLAHYLGRATRDVDHAVFNSSQVTLQAATGATLLAAGGWDVSHPTFTSADLSLFAVAGGVMYLINTLAVAGVVALRTGQPLRRVWTGTTLYPDRTGAV
ncbi:MAG: hypothetical protein H0W06_01460 [Chloroflexia bacterium]|nr:hypothetical protein [Chloroflexia bacterium]